MNYRSLGRTGVQVSPMALGCMHFGDSASVDESCAMVDRALDAGINFFDTANIYAQGRSESALGVAFQRNGKRDRAIIATKVHGSVDETDPNAWGNSRRHLIAQCEASLRRLQTDYIDLYQLHRPQPEVPIEETLGAMDDLVRSGKVRYIGTSMFSAWQIVEGLWTSDRRNWNRFISEQPQYNLLDRRIENDTLPVALRHGIALIVFSPLAKGLLTGKYKRNMPAPPGSRYADLEKRPWLKGALNDRMFDALDAIGPLAREKDCALSQLALAWAMAQPGVTSAIIGPRSMEHLEDNLGALNVAITDEDKKKIDAICPSGGKLI